MLSYFPFFFRFHSADDIDITTFITTEDKVMHIKADLFMPGNVLYTYGNSLKTTDYKTIQSIVGVPAERGYKESTGDAVRFGFITGFHQHGKNKVIMIDNGNHCVRVVDRSTRKSTAFAGLCSTEGWRDGTKARFNSPTNIISDVMSPGQLLITDRNNKAIRHLNTTSRAVTTFVRVTWDRNFLPSGITQHSKSGKIYVTTNRYVYEIDYQQKFPKAIAGGSSNAETDGPFRSARFNVIYDALLINEGNEIVLADYYNSVRLMDMRGETVSSICKRGGHQDGYRKACTVDQPSAVAVIGTTLYIGEYQRVRKIEGKQCCSLHVSCPSDLRF